MSTETLDPSLPRHGALTRLAHAVLGTAVVVQLASSQVMNPDNGGNAISDIHEFAGLVACAAVLAFRAVVMVRRYGTAPGTLVPWFSGARRAALRQDTRAHLADLAKARLPAHDPQSPLDGAIHGLGLVIVTLMAASGTLHCAVNAGDPDAGGLVGVAMGVHPACASLAWGDLILHAGAAVVDHFATDMSLRDMWRVRCCGAKDCAKTSAERTPS